MTRPVADASVFDSLCLFDRPRFAEDAPPLRSEEFSLTDLLSLAGAGPTALVEMLIDRRFHGRELRDLKAAR